MTVAEGDMMMKDGKAYMLLPFYDAENGKIGPLVWGDLDLEGRYTITPLTGFPEIAV